MSRLRALLIFGTRPEAIKMAPVVAQCRRRGEAIEPIVCGTAQHRQMLDEVLVRVRPDCVVAQGDTTTVMAVAYARLGVSAPGHEPEPNGVDACP